MNLHTVFEELNRLYESVEDPEKLSNGQHVEEAVEESCANKKLTETAEDEEIVIVDDEEVVGETSTQLVLECSNCGGLMIKPEAEVTIDEETDLATFEDACQYCEETTGYKVIGTFVPYEAAEEVEETEEPAAEVETADEEEPVEESLLDVDLPVTANVNIKADGNSVPFMNTGI